MAYLVKLKGSFLVISNEVFKESLGKKLPIVYYAYCDKHVKRPISYDDVIDWKYLGDADLFIAKKGKEIWNILESTVKTERSKE